MAPFNLSLTILAKGPRVYIHFGPHGRIRKFTFWGFITPLLTGFGGLKTFFSQRRL